MVLTSFGELAIKQTNDHFDVISKQKPNKYSVELFYMINISMGINTERKFKSLLFMCADLIWVFG